jgi:hypothetical protein
VTRAAILAAAVLLCGAQAPLGCIHTGPSTITCGSPASSDALNMPEVIREIMAAPVHSVGSPEPAWRLVIQRYSGAVAVTEWLAQADCERERDRAVGQPATEDERHGLALLKAKGLVPKGGDIPHGVPIFTASDVRTAACFSPEEWKAAP